MPKGVYQRGKDIKIPIRTEEWKRNISKSLIGRVGSMTGHKHSEESKLMISKSNIGKKVSKEGRLKMSLSHIGLTPWNKNKKCPQFSGKNNANWNGGTSYGIYSVNWTNSLKISIRERDKYTCQICGEKQGDKTHHIHHIDYDKQNCNPNNLITLCRSCHMRTNNNQKYWEKYFKDKVYVK